MSGRTVAVGTDQVSPADRPAWWAGALATLCGRLHTDTLGAPSFDGVLEYGAVGPLKLCHIEASRHRVGLSSALARTEKHPVIKVVLQLEGESVYEQGGVRAAIGPGEGLAYDVSRPHRITSAGSTKHLVVIIPKSLAAQRGLTLDDLREQQFSTRAGVGRVAHDLVSSTMNELQRIDETCEAELAETILDLLTLPLAKGGAGRAFSSPTALMRQRIEQYIEANIFDPELNLDQIASALHCSKRYLHMVYADQGYTLTERIWAARLEASKRALIEPRGRSVTEIAFGCGFSSASHFSRAFKRRFGVSPSVAGRRPIRSSS